MLTRNAAFSGANHFSLTHAPRRASHGAVIFRTELPLSRDFRRQRFIVTADFQVLLWQAEMLPLAILLELLESFPKNIHLLKRHISR